MNPRCRNSLILLHIVILLWGFTGILGKQIGLPAEQIVWYRMGIAGVSLGLYRRIGQQSLALARKEWGMVFVGGVFLAVHWYAFFAAIQASNVSVTLTTLSCGTLFTALLEPLFFRRRIDPREVIFGLFVIIGLSMIFSIGQGYRKGIYLSLLSAFMAALFTVINGKSIQRVEASLIAWYQMGIGFLLFTAILGLRHLLGAKAVQLPSPSDTLWLVVLGTICTAFAFTLSIKVMKELSPYTVTLATNLEPVYGILLAILFFGDSEFMGIHFYLGAAIILLAVLVEERLRRRQARTSQSQNESV